MILDALLSPNSSAAGDIPRRDAATLAARDLGAILRFVVHAEGGDPPRGVKLDVARGRLRAVCTDGHRLALAECSAAGDLNLVLSTGEAKRVMRELRADTTAELRHKGARLRVAASGQVHETVACSGDDFPPYREFIPAFRRGVPFVEVDTSPLCAGLKAVPRLPRDENLILAILPPGSLSVHGYEVAAKRGAGGPTEIPFQYAYVKNAAVALRAFGVQRVRLELHGPEKPLLMEAAHGDPRYGTCCVLIMPRRDTRALRGRVSPRAAR